MHIKTGILLGILSYGILLASETKQIEPFGIKLNQQLHKSIITSDIVNSDMKVLSNPPKPVSLFTTYGLSLNKSKKVTIVVGIGKTHKNDDYCFSSQSEFTKIENILTKKYSNPSTSSNYLVHDSIWTDAKYYRMSLVENQRSHYARWDRIPSHPNIEILLEEEATREGCYVKLVYKDKNLTNEQIKEQDSADAESF